MPGIWGVGGNLRSLIDHDEVESEVWAQRVDGAVGGAGVGGQHHLRVLGERCSTRV